MDPRLPQYRTARAVPAAPPAPGPARRQQQCAAAQGGDAGKLGGEAGSRAPFCPRYLKNEIGKKSRTGGKGGGGQAPAGTRRARRGTGDPRLLLPRRK